MNQVFVALEAGHCPHEAFCSAQQHHLCNFGRGYYELKFREIILNLDQWSRRCRLKIFLTCSSGSPLVQ